MTNYCHTDWQLHRPSANLHRHLQTAGFWACFAMQFCGDYYWVLVRIDSQKQVNFASHKFFQLWELHSHVKSLTTFLIKKMPPVTEIDHAYPQLTNWNSYGILFVGLYDVKVVQVYFFELNRAHLLSGRHFHPSFDWIEIDFLKNISHVFVDISLNFYFIMILLKLQDFLLNRANKNRFWSFSKMIFFIFGFH